MTTEPSTSSAALNKPVELYIFIDPLCQKGFEIQAIVRKLQVEYDHYFTLRFVLSTELATLNCAANQPKECNFIDNKFDMSHPVFPSIAVKAAELQGKKAGLRFLAKLQEHVLLQSKNINAYSTLIEIAAEAQLDTHEFETDFGSKEAARAFQCDLYIKREMEVDEVPSIVFFNECIEDEGLKVTGNYNYEVYEHILAEMLGEPIIRQSLPTMEELFIRFHSLTTQDFAFIYSISEQEAERELKKRMLQQKIERIQAQEITLWRLKDTSNLNH